MTDVEAMAVLALTAVSLAMTSHRLKKYRRLGDEHPRTRRHQGSDFSNQ